MYPDGRHRKRTDSTGYGIRIILHHKGREKILLNHSEGLGNKSVSEAELAVIQEALYWLKHEYKSLLPAIHIFTDSKYALNY